MMKKTRFIALVGLCLLLAASANAATVSVNFNITASSTDAMGSTDLAGVELVGNWNNVTSPTDFGSLIDSSGAVSAVSGGMTAGGLASWNRNNDPTEGRIFSDFVSNIPNAATLDITGITYAKYDLYIYIAQWGSNASTITVGSDAQAVNKVNDPWATPFYFEGSTYVKFEGLTGSTATATWSDVAGEAGIGGFQVVQVPEPMTMALLGLGGLFLRRRK
jgi:hypothetical protein